MRRRLGGLLAALVMAATGAFVIVSHVRSIEQRALAGERVVDVLVATQAIPRGTPAAALGELVDHRQVPAKIQAVGSVDDLAALEGKVAAVDLLPGEQLLAARFVTPGELRAAARVPVPAGLQQVTVSLAPERALGGLLQPGQLVGVVASFDQGALPDGQPDPGRSPVSHMILQKVLVTSVQGEALTKPEDGGEEGARPPAPAQALLVTLAVSGPSAERIVFAAEHGSLWLTLQPDDVRTDGVRVQTRERVYQ